MKEYKIEIWRHYSITETYESKDIKEILNWYESNYQMLYNIGGCMFYIYENGEKLSFEDTYGFGFYNIEEEEE